MKPIFRTLLIPLFLVAVMTLTTLTTACPSGSSIAKAAKASDQLAGLTLTAINTTKTAYESNLISLSTKDTIAAKLVTLSKGGQTFNAAVKNLQAVYAAGNMPPDQLATLSALFDVSVVGPFLDVLKDFGLIKNAPAILAVVNAIRSAVLTVAGVFGGKVSLRLQGVPIGTS